MKIILGSKSENRRWVLRQARYTFGVMVADVNEKSIRHDNFYELPLLLARAKTEALLPRVKESALLITADQVVVWKNELREKPRDLNEARRFLETFSGSPFPAECVNGIMITNTTTGHSKLEREISKVFFSKIPPENIESFLASGDALAFAGGFTPQSPLIAPFIRIEGSLESVLGLPINVVKRYMKEMT